MRRVSGHVFSSSPCPDGQQYGTQVEPGKPEQFCVPLRGLGNGAHLSVAPYPVAWRLAIAEDDEHRGYEYVR